MEIIIKCNYCGEYLEITSTDFNDNAGNITLHLSPCPNCGRKQEETPLDIEV